MVCFRKIILIAICLVIAGCSHVQQGVDPRFADALSQPYRLDTGDRVRIIVFGQDNLTNSYTIDDRGQISMPLIGTVDARGHTLGAIKASVTSRLAARYLRDPNVSIEVEQYRPFFILGEVNTAGQYPYVSGLTGRSAVAIAGGFSPRAQSGQMVIQRQVDGSLITAAVPLNHPILPGDTVHIQERWF